MPPGASGVGTVGATAGERRSAQGLTARLQGPRGEIGAFGAAVDSSLGATLAGTRRVAVAAPPFARSAVAVLCTLVAATVVGAVRRRSRRR